MCRLKRSMRSLTEKCNQMTKRDVINDLHTITGGCGFISQNKLRKWYGQSFSALKELLRGVDYVQKSRKKLYYVGDVAEAVMKRRSKG